MAILDIEYGREILADSDSEHHHQEIIKMEMALQNSSYSHEYARMELAQELSFFEKECLHEQLENSRQAYFQARQFLSKHHPERLKALEQELLDQKQRVFQSYRAS